MNSVWLLHWMTVCPSKKCGLIKLRNWGSRPAVAKLLKAMDEIDHTVDDANGKSVTNTFRITTLDYFVC